MSARDQIEAEVRARARHETKDEVSDTRSFAEMERTLRREYHGRFLIELIQNARDAWMKDGNHSTDGILRINLSGAPPALSVCNRGTPVSPDVVLYSLGKFGESTKRPGEGIGHKGIGFKAVLEITPSPEIYSRDAQSPEFTFRVVFDPHRAFSLIRERSPRWDELERSLPSVAAGTSGRGVDAVPTLRFPLWRDQTPRDVAELGNLEGQAFNTIVRLPYRAGARLDLDESEWLRRVRSALADLSDEMVILLGVFRTVVVEDELAGRRHRIERRLGDERPLPAGGSVRRVEILRDGNSSSRWLIYERTLEGFRGLEGNISVGVRLEEVGGSLRPAQFGGDSEKGGLGCFHLFFPTRIRTNLPFLLNAYFEVDASRQAFARDSEERNRELLDGLRQLAVDAVADLAGPQERGLDPTSLPDLFERSSGEPEDPLARAFRESLIKQIDDVPWVAVRDPGTGIRVARPRELLVDARDRLPELLPRAFPPAYACERLGIYHPDPSIGSDGLEFLTGRLRELRGAEEPGIDEATISALLRPGRLRIWAEGADQGFHSLLETLQYLRAVDRDHTIDVVNALRGASDASFIPVLEEDGENRRFLPPPPTYSPGTPDRGPAIFARLGRGDGESPTPPAALDVAFLADGLLTSDLVADAGRLGIREYTTDALLDRLARVPARRRDAPDLLVFAWRTLLRESESTFGLARAVGSYPTFEPGRWFWYRSQREEGDLQRRARALANLLVPTRAGTWRPATQLSFGRDWAEWLDSVGESSLEGDHAERADSYRDLERLAPSSDALVAHPAEVARRLPWLEQDTQWLGRDDSSSAWLMAGGLAETDVHLTLIHALLLRLGVWEVPPVVALFDKRVRRKPERDPWRAIDDRREYHSALRQMGLWSFYTKYEHENVHVGEDARFLWPLSGDSGALVRALARGVQFYKQVDTAVLFCQGCNTHRTRYETTGAHRVPSFLEWQLTKHAWVPITRDGVSAEPVRPSEAWWMPDPPDGTRIRQSPRRFLALTRRDFPADLARLAGINSFEAPSIPRVMEELGRLRREFEARTLEPDPNAGGLERQTFIGIHRQLYEVIAESEDAGAIEWLGDSGVLSESDRHLKYVMPSEARHDSGRFGSYKRHFIGRVPFSVLAKEKDAVAARLGIPRFSVEIIRKESPGERDVTDHVAGMIHSRLPQILALTSYYRVAGDTIEPGGQAFVERAERLRSLRVVQTDELVLEARVAGTSIIETIGRGPDRDLYLEGPTSRKPVLYHDFNGDGWEERLRKHLAPHLAALVENPSYEDAFALLLQREDPGELEAFMLDKGISSEEIERVEVALELTRDLSRKEEQVWWSALLPLVAPEARLELSKPLEPQLRTALGVLDSSPSEGFLAEKLLRVGGGRTARSDTSEDGVLAGLEAHGVDLQALHARLVEQRDSGLEIEVASRLLRRWSARHGRQVALLLYRGGLPLEHAKKAFERWDVPDELRFRVNVSLVQVLSPVVVDLAKAAVQADAGKLAGPDTEAYLASLSGLEEDFSRRFPWWR